MRGVINSIHVVHIPLLFLYTIRGTLTTHEKCVGRNIYRKKKFGQYGLELWGTVVTTSGHSILLLTPTEKRVPNTRMVGDTKETTYLQDGDSPTEVYK